MAEVIDNEPAFAPTVSVVTVVFNRKDQIIKTIESVLSQSYNQIDYVIIDGGSTDGTIELIEGYADRISYFTSGKDNGIYDAINKGIDASSGDYVVILHAGDTLEPDFISNSVEVLRKENADPLRTVTYANYRHGDKAVEAGAFSAGVYLYHFGINHSTFLVPKALYETIGAYDPNLRIVSDAIWMRRAMDFGCTFLKVDGFPLFFDTGGASSAQSEEQRNLVIGEWVASYRLIFSFLPEPVARAVYLFRFEEQALHAISLFLEECRHVEDPPLNWALFRRALALMVRHIWSLRPLAASASREDSFRARLRISVADDLGIPMSEINLSVADRRLIDVLDEVEGLAARLAGKDVALHFLEVFSRPSETFVPDLVKALDDRDDMVHVIVCEKRVLADERPYPNILVFPFEEYPRAIAKRLMEQFLDRLNIRRFIFHFAINGWRFLERLDPKYRAIPALYMTHGIDVADLVEDSDYRRFIIDGVARTPNARFTAVSQYLKHKLLDVGAPENMISVVHNSIHERFWQNRTAGFNKKEARRASSFDIRLVNIGRLVPFKGHEYLISAIRILKDEFNCDAHLTIVWGGHGPLLTEVEALIKRENLQERVNLVESVNFDETPGFYDQFDVFVSSSIETGGSKSRSETFGVAILEAIASGLPVIVSEAGAQPEVIGAETRFARLAMAESAQSLAEEINHIRQNGAMDGDNADYARERLEKFSRDRQVELIEEAFSLARAPSLNAALFSTTIDRGAGGGAYKVHRSLVSAGVKSQIHCLERTSDFSARVGVNAVTIAAYHREKSHQLDNKELFRNHTIFSLDPEGVEPKVLQDICAEADVINLHWYARFLSNRNIADLSNMGKPLVITLRDMHPLTGGCHYSHGCEEWRRSCSVCAQIPQFSARLPNKTLMWKVNNWNLSNITLVALSEFSKKMIEDSRLFGGCRVEVIPNPVEAEIFEPFSQLEAREEFGVSPDAKVIAYLPSFSSSIKGAKEAVQALKRLPPTIEGRPVELLTAGASTVIHDLPFPVRSVDYISDRKKLARLFAATDVTLAPSLAETFSNTVQESLACGTPVAGFRTGAIPEMAQGERGGVAELGDSITLAQIVRDLLSKPEKPVEACRNYVLESHGEERIAQKYTDLFRDLISEAIEKRTFPAPNEDVRELQRRYLADRLTVASRKASSAIARKNAQALQTVFTSLHTGEGVNRRDGRIVVEAGGPRHVIYGPYIKPEVGQYQVRLNINFFRAIRLNKSRCVFEISAGDAENILVDEFFIGFFEKSLKLDYEFNYSQEVREQNKGGLEFRLWSDGKEGFEILNLSIEAA